MNDMGDVSPRKEVAYRCLIDAARSLSAASELDALVDHILASAREVMQCRAASVSLPETATGDLIIRGTQQELKGQVLRVPTGKGIAGRVFKTRLPENTSNAQNDSDHYGGIGLETNTPAKAMLTIPLLDGDVCHGVMQALNPTGRDFFDKFDEEVFLAFGSLIATTITRMRVQENAKQKEIEEAYRAAELSVARLVQFSFMPPKVFAAEGLRISVFQEQAADVGGDFYAYEEVDRGLLAVVGDASGKGVPAALEAARVATLISLKASSCTADTLPEWLAEVNNVLQEKADKSGSLTTLTVLLVEWKRRRIHACSFGQFCPRYLSVGNRWEQLACEVYPPLGLFAADRFAVTSVPLGLGSQWLLLTDGFVEARNASGEQFGQRALEQALSESAYDQGDVLGVMETRWRLFSGPGPDRDDATALLLTDTSARPAQRYESDLTPENIVKVRLFCERWAAFAGIEEDAIYKVVLACDEILTNVYKHAYHGQVGAVRCDAGLDQNFLSYFFVHWGDGLSSDEVSPARVSSSSRSGGYGLPFVRQVFDEVKFERDNDCCTVTLRKRILSTAKAPEDQPR
jgi:sigma-B regulation protein RsbU (phosphoserine phosphatase)